MKTVTITFKVSEEKTTVRAEGITGIVIEHDITNTNIENKFKELLNDLHEYQLASELEDAINPKNWKEVTEE